MAGLVAELCGADEHEGFTYGLLHDIGKLFILKSRSDFARRGGDTPSREEFDETMAECHTVIGEMAMHLWGLPIAIREPIRFHHSPAEAPTYRNECTIAYAANRLSHRYGFGCQATPRESLADDPVCASLGVTTAWLTQMDGKAPALFQTLRKGLQ